MSIEVLATVILGLALVHSFATPAFARLPKKLHFLAEVELVFGIWALLFLICYALFYDFSSAVSYARTLSMTEPLFVFCIMVLASSRPVVTLARRIILALVSGLSCTIPLDEKLIQVFVLLGIGPLLGSIITEPAAITILALLLYRMLEGVSEKLLYSVLALLFVNVSVGGGLTHFAAPPILIVAQKFGWGLSDVFRKIGETVICTTIVNAVVFCVMFKKSILSEIKKLEPEHYPMPFFIMFVHMIFLVLLVVFAHQEKFFLTFFAVFVAFTMMTKKYQDGLKYKESFMVAFFLAGLIVLGSLQKWWLEPLLTLIQGKALYFTATGLTAITDNAALTYLGSQVESLTETSKWALVSGAITGGGLTILANAPNPAGFAVLSPRFENGSLNAAKLFLAALIPTSIAVVFFMILGNF